MTPAPRARYVAGGVLMIVVAVLVYALVVISDWLGLSPQAVQGATRVPITGSVVLLTDGVTIVYSDPGAFCSESNLTAAQAKDTVVLSLTESFGFGYGPCGWFPFGPGGSRPASPADAIAPGTAASPATVKLTSPLGRRGLVDAATGRTVPVFDQRQALQLTGTRAFTGDAVTTDAPYFGGPGAAVLVDDFYGVDSSTYQPNGAWLMIVQVAGGGWHPPAGTVTRQVTVRGHHGLAALGIVVWSEAARTIAVLGRGPARGLSGGAPLSLPQLLAIAGNLSGGSQG